MNTAFQILNTLEHLGRFSVSHKSISCENPLRINFNPSKNQLAIQGKAVRKKDQIQYTKLIKEVEAHVSNGPLSVQLGYDLFDTTTAKFIFSLIKILNKAHLAGKKVKTDWLINNQSKDMVEAGMDFQTFCKFPFEIKFQ